MCAICIYAKPVFLLKIINKNVLGVFMEILQNVIINVLINSLNYQKVCNKYKMEPVFNIILKEIIKRKKYRLRYS